MPAPEPADEPLVQLAARIKRAGLGDAAAFALDIISPLDLISSQFAQFSRPFLAGGRWAPYAAALAERESWQVLRSLLMRNEC